LPVVPAAAFGFELEENILRVINKTFINEKITRILRWYQKNLNPVFCPILFLMEMYMDSQIFRIFKGVVIISAAGAARAAHEYLTTVSAPIRLGLRRATWAPLHLCRRFRPGAAGGLTPLHFDNILKGLHGTADDHASGSSRPSPDTGS
jgi:hypothetical protein